MADFEHSTLHDCFGVLVLSMTYPSNGVHDYSDGKVDAVCQTHPASGSSAGVLSLTVGQD